MGPRTFLHRPRGNHTLLGRRRAIFGRARLEAKARRASLRHETDLERQLRQPRGYDPELLYVECGRCGAPVLWDDGRATTLMAEAGIDPLELDSSCILVTDGCPGCGSRSEYSVRIFRVAQDASAMTPPLHGHA